ncbi:MAG: LLM class flavin-dependent oxidoreductase [Thaumarchaeota archaeon]|nr:LLM class flavin-dependent oxidoreductase [Nitrososphaerota archaeon]MCL5318692.1 LLM class flavin-dependent oxidoreductase [Nitrososphaerota archaeon]
MIKFGVGLIPDEDYSLTVRRAVKAEKAGFDYVLMSDHLKGRNAYVSLTIVAENTRKVRIGPGVTNPYLIHPAVTAQILASLSEIAPGRVVCGIGAGDKEGLRRLGVEQVRPVAAVRKAAQTISTLLADRRIPILVGAQGDRMLRLAGEIGDGIIINSADPRECKRAVEIVRRSGLETGRTLDGFEWGAEMPFSAARSWDEAVKQVRSKVAVIVSGCPDPVLERLSIPLEDRERVKDALRRNDRDAVASAVTSEMVDSLAVAGTPDACLMKIQQLIKSGVTLLVLAPPLGPTWDEAVNLIAEEALPRMR